jgi:hypothetical protein
MKPHVKRAVVAMGVGVVVIAGACKGGSTGPDVNAVTQLAVAPTSVTMASLGDTTVLTASPRNASGTLVSTPVSWTSDDPLVAAVGTDGSVVAVSNGATTIRASASGVTTPVPLTVRQQVDSIAVAGTSQGAEIGSPLDSAVTVTLLDARANPIASAPVSFAVSSGGGSVDPTDVVTDAAGAGSTTWTLGYETGIQELSVAGGLDGEGELFVATNAWPMDPDTVTLYAGDAQTEVTGMPLPAPLQVLVVDSLGNPVPDVPVVFSVDADASLDQTEVTTDLDGIASVSMTLGSTLGTYTAQAVVPDSAIGTIVDFPGSPVVFTAEAVLFALATPAAPSITVGDTVTLSGTGFDPLPDGNSVTIGGLSATVVGGTQSELTVEVPGFGCVPSVSRLVEVTRSVAAGPATVSQTAPVTAAEAIDLAVGERRLIDDPSDFCLQFLSGSNEEYLMGLTSTRWIQASATFEVLGLDTLTPPPAAPAPTTSAAPVTQAPETEGGPITTELGLRSFEERLLASGVQWSARAEGPARSSPVEGEVLNLRIPDLGGDPCLDYVPVTATVFFVGSRLALATNVSLPSPIDPAIIPLLDSLNSLTMGFDGVGMDLLLTYLGHPADWDPSERVLVVMAPEVSSAGLPVYASAVDQLPRSVCPSSDEDKIVYVAVPPAATASQLAAVVGTVPPDLAHHIGHIIQWGRRITQGGSILPGWLGEGQAEVAVEIAGMAVSGLNRQQNYTSAVMGLPNASKWLQKRFDRLSLFQGWDGAASVVPGAPQNCSIFGLSGPEVPCAPEYAPGAAWSFMRYVNDRLGILQAGGEDGFQQALIDTDPTGDPLAVLEQLTGLTVPQLIVDWATMLYVDGRLSPAEAPEFQMTSWDLTSLIPAGPKRLNPETFTDFTSFTRTGSVIGGGTAYTLMTTAGAHSAMAVRFGDGTGGPVSSLLEPRLWVVRMR